MITVSKDGLEIPMRESKKPMRFSIYNVSSTKSKQVTSSGKLEGGYISKNQNYLVMPHGIVCHIKGKTSKFIIEKINFFNIYFFKQILLEKLINFLILKKDIYKDGHKMKTGKVGDNLDINFTLKHDYETQLLS